MRLEERIQQLCAQVVTEKNPDRLSELLAELMAALRQHRDETEAILVLHRRLFKDVS